MKIAAEGIVSELCKVLCVACLWLHRVVLRLHDSNDFCDLKFASITIAFDAFVALTVWNFCFLHILSPNSHLWPSEYPETNLLFENGFLGQPGAARVNGVRLAFASVEHKQFFGFFRGLKPLKFMTLCVVRLDHASGRQAESVGRRLGRKLCQLRYHTCPQF